MRHHKPRFDKEPNKLCVSARNGAIPQKDDTPSMRDKVRYTIRFPFALKRFGKPRFNSHKNIPLYLSQMAVCRSHSMLVETKKDLRRQKRSSVYFQMRLRVDLSFSFLRGQGLSSYKHLLYFQIPIVDRPFSIIRDIHHGVSLS
jgi:hypothetical protein